MELHSHLAQDSKKLKEDMAGDLEELQAHWPRTNKLGEQISNSAHKLPQFLASFNGLQSTVAAAPLMPSKTHSNFSLGHPNLR